MMWHDIGGDAPPPVRIQNIILKARPQHFQKYEAKEIEGVGILLIRYAWENMTPIATHFIILEAPE